jgi:hypothetical protein
MKKIIEYIEQIFSKMSNYFSGNNQNFSEINEQIQVTTQKKEIVKEFQVQRKSYQFDKITRTLKNNPEWKHVKYYKSMEAAKDAVRGFRNSIYEKVYYDYPAMLSGEENEKKYPKLTPRITINRYRAVKRNDLPEDNDLIYHVEISTPQFQPDGSYQMLNQRGNLSLNTLKFTPDNNQIKSHEVQFQSTDDVKKHVKKWISLIN